MLVFSSGPSHCSKEVLGSPDVLSEVVALAAKPPSLSALFRVPVLRPYLS